MSSSSQRRVLRLQHPARAARSAFRRGRHLLLRRLAKRRAERDSRHIRRDSRDGCWCGGDLLPFEHHASYGRCRECGSFVNRRPPVQEDLSELYSLDFYWQRRQALKGHPTIERRAELYRSDGRLDAWLRLVEKYGPSAGSVIEVGCAPGVLLESLAEQGYECVGVEISEAVATWMRDTIRLDIRAGFFPGVDLPHCDLFLSFDTLEHNPSPDEFVREAARLLVPGGVAIIQTAIERYEYNPPFGERFDLFDDLEHLFLFTDQAMERLAADARLEVVSLDERIWLGGEVAVFRKPTSAVRA